MIRLFIATLFSLLVANSACAGIFLDLHLIDHANHQGHSSKHSDIDKDKKHSHQESLIDYFVFHSAQHHKGDHEHFLQEITFSSALNLEIIKLLSPQLLYLPSQTLLPNFKKLLLLADVKFNASLVIPSNPNRFRSTPLLN